jgi:hypothetical protein
MSANNLQMGIRAGGNSEMNFSYPVGASEIFKKLGASFVTVDGSGRIEVAGAADTAIIGSAVFNEDFTSSSTEGGTNLPVNIDLNAVFEIPINAGTYAATMRGETCDLSDSSNVIGANLTASSVDIIEIVDAGYTNAAGTVTTVLVKLFIPKLTRTGVV